MTCVNAERWALFSMGLLSADEIARLRSHARACAACRLELDAALAFDADLRSLHAGATDHDRLREEMLDLLPAGSAGALCHREFVLPDTRGNRIMRLVSRHPFGVIGIAAAVLAAIGLFFVASNGSVAWADVVQRLGRVTSVSVRHATFKDGPSGPELCIKQRSCASEAHGHRVDTYSADGRLSTTEYMLPVRGEWVKVVHDDDGSGYFERTAMNESNREQMAAYTPASWAVALLNLTEDRHAQWLEDTMLEGRRTAVFESRNATIWVDIATKLPVRLETDGPYTEVYDEFRWDAPLDVSLFEPDIPAGYADASRPDPQNDPQSWLADAIERVSSVHAISYDTRMTRSIDGVPNPVLSLTGRRYFAEGLGVRTETYQGDDLIVVEIYNARENTWIWVSHLNRTYNLVRFAEGEERAGGWHLTPEQWIDGFAALTENEHVTGLEASVIRSRRCLGFETRATLPEEFGGGERTDRYWIDETGLFPARCEHIVPTANPPGRMEMIEENFFCNPRLEIELFDIEVPDGYRSIRETAEEGSSAVGD